MVCHWEDKKVVLGTWNPVVSNCLIILKCVYADAFITCQKNEGGWLQVQHASLSIIKYGRKMLQNVMRIFFIASIPIKEISVLC